MGIGSGSTRRIAVIAEATYGVTPATPAFDVLRMTGGGPRTNKSTGMSEEIQLDRNVRDEFMLGQDVAGDYNFEFSYGTLDKLLEGALQSAWATNVLKNGTTQKSFTFEETVDLDGSNSFSRFLGVMVNTLNLSIASRAKVTGSMGLIGQKETLDTAIITGATYIAANTKPIATASASVAALSLAGGTPKVKSLSMQITNNLRTRETVGNLYTEKPGSGLFEVTGTMDCYFESNALYQSVLAHNATGTLAFTLGATANEKYSFLLPKIVLGNGERRPGGRDDDLMLSLPFRGVYDTTEACSLKITRAVA